MWFDSIQTNAGWVEASTKFVEEALHWLQAEW